MQLLQHLLVSVSLALSPAQHHHHHHHHRPDHPAAQRWAHTRKARQVTFCESTHRPRLIDVNGGTTYFGEWQMNSDFVRTYGHVNPWHHVHRGRFTLSRQRQNVVAYRGWRSRGWEPWACG